MRCYTGFIPSDSDLGMEAYTTTWHANNRDCESSYVDLNAFFLFFGAGGVPHFSYAGNHMKTPWGS